MPTKEQLDAFLALPQDDPVVMLNLLTFKPQATGAYAGRTGRDAVLEYSRAMREYAEAHDGSFVLAADVDLRLIGDGGERIDFVRTVRSPSRRAFLELAGDPEIARTIGRHRDDGLESQWAARDDGGDRVTSVYDIPTARTPEGGYGDEMPPPFLAGCDDPLPTGAPDLRGTWKTVDASALDGSALPPDHPIHAHVERIEQAGDRVIVTSSGVVHDMIADGTYERGVNDVMASDFTTAITVAATFEDGALVLRPRGLDGVEVRRWREGEQLVWRYHTLFEARLERIDG